MASMFPTEAAMFAVMVVPIFSPRTIAAAISNCIQPIFSIIRVRATVALEDCSTRVSMVPRARKRSTEPKPCPDQVWMNPRTSGWALRSGTDSFIRDKPRNRRLNPIMNSLMLRNLSFFERLITKPRAISGTARAETSALNPKMEMIQAVIVVPIFAPIITPIAWARVSRPALTNPTTITVVALED